ncbi:MAG TPA: DUF5047 domain-containing protein [Natronosporangium sp.]|nr:DUF5047 domain-containing protein [Natronosporangium sp.]
MTTAQIAATISGSHTMRVEARAVTPGQVGDDPDGIEIPIVSGDVQLDGTADVYATLNLTTDGRTLWPRLATDPLAPYGQEIWVRRGVDLGDEVLWIPLGYFRVETVEQDQADDGPIRISGSDRMAGIIDARFVRPRQLDSGSVVGDVVRDLVTEVSPSAEVVFDDELEFATLGRTIVVEESRYDVLREIVTVAGKIWHWDGEGRLLIRSAPDPEGEPLWQVRAGSGGVLVQARRSLTREGVYNAVSVRGEGADVQDPALAVVVDDGPNSPTRWGGPFGKVPRFYSSPLITTEAQAVSAGEGILRRNLGLPYTLDYSQVPNPQLRPWDTVRLVHKHGDRELHVVETVTIPLDASTAQRVTTREQTRTLVRRL